MEIKNGILYQEGKDPLVLSEKELNGIEGYIKLLLIGRVVKEMAS